MVPLVPRASELHGNRRGGGSCGSRSRSPLGPRPEVQGPSVGASCPSSFSGLGTEEAVARRLGFHCLSILTLLSRLATVVHGACPVRGPGCCLSGAGPVARGWIGPSPSKRWQTSHRVFMTVVHISLYELIAPFRLGVLPERLGAAEPMEESCCPMLPCVR